MESIKVRGLLPSRAEDVGNPLPTPGPEWEGQTVSFVEDEKTELVACLRNSQGDYEWIEIGEST